MKHYIGIDIGGTSIKYAVFDEKATILFHHAVLTPIGNAGDQIPKALYGIIDQLMSVYDGVQGVGISTAGVVNPLSGAILFAGDTLPGYAGTKLKALLQQRYGLPVAVANDVNAAACGEWWKGAARGYGHFFCVTIGTGIGGALFSGGQLVHGRRFRAGEVGHALYDKRSGTTYEQRASMTALMQMAAAELPDFHGGGRELFDLARSGDAACAALIARWTEEVARGLAEITLVADPAMIVIGGAVSEQKEFLLDFIRAHLNRYVPAQFGHAPLVAAQLGNRAALYGAIYPFFYTEETERDSYGNRIDQSI
ncbi:ROK family protein [Paenibacillus curdlanolyticus YK9]|uniref:ROK family protein n=1 Tax=Paenibacillus curdlanolyticus YK9 TaxID=717606 RepID=E0IEY8_9BACL|nr:ROK family protein [Paenibacillus curdlanolyticus]EFM08764.1 ROK family protein [Paenibacillus curdlanolyticus YK9]